jgi:hypothetical protein
MGDNISCLRWARNFTSQGGNWETPTDSISLNQWQYVVATYNEDSPSNYPLLYINGVSQTVIVAPGHVPSGSVEPDTASNMRIGGFAVDDTRDFDGIIDEVRLSTTIRDASWIATEYNNQNSPGTFILSISTEQTQGSMS